MRIAVKFAYDGQSFYGYARQPNLRTVEGEVIKTLIKHGFIEDTKESRFLSASRTDKKVSALCNLVAFNTSFTSKKILDDLILESDEIAFYASTEVHDGFNPRYAKSRIYRYYLRHTNLDLDRVTKTLSLFTGIHDFSNFARLEKFKNPVRKIDNIVISELDDFLIIDFYAPNFLWNQIRRIISAVQKVGACKIDKEEVAEALSNPDKNFDFNVAPADPLILKDITYDFDFGYKPSYLNELSKLENKVLSSL